MPILFYIHHWLLKLFDYLSDNQPEQQLSYDEFIQVKNLNLKLDIGLAIAGGALKGSQSLVDEWYTWKAKQPITYKFNSLYGRISGGNVGIEAASLYDTVNLYRIDSLEPVDQIKIPKV